MKSRAEQAEETRASILHAAQEILSSQGSNGLTSGKLANKLGISKGTLFHHYKSMEEIHLAVLESIIRAMTEGVESKEYSSITELFETATDAIFHEYETYRGVYVSLLQFIGNADHNEAYLSKLKDFFNAMLTSWENSLRQNLRNDVPQEKIASAIRIIDTYFAGLLIHNLIFDDPAKYKALTKTFLTQMQDYLEKS